MKHLMDRLVSIDRLSGTAVLKLAPEDEEKDTKIERVRETEVKRVWEHYGGWGWAGGCATGYTTCSGKDQARTVESLICQPACIRRCSLRQRSSKSQSGNALGTTFPLNSFGTNSL